MQIFLILCSVALALSHPQGYSYQQTFGVGQKNTPQTSDTPISIGSVANSHNQREPNFSQQTLDHFQPSFGYPASQPSTVPIYNQQTSALFTPNHAPQYSQEPVYSLGQQQAYFNALEQNSVGPTVTKDIFVHVAPRELEQYQHPRPLPQAPPRKHYRIVFIKAPNPPSTASLQVQQAPVEEKTIIYVLTKKADPIDIKALQEASKPTQIHKPEVYFIKYKTQEEAKQAQLSIQAEYDKLGGTSQVSDEGIAPVTSVIGAFDNRQSQHNQHSTADQTDAAIDLRSGLGSNVSPVTNYLPAYKQRL